MTKTYRFPLKKAFRLETLPSGVMEISDGKQYFFSYMGCAKSVEFSKIANIYIYFFFYFIPFFKTELSHFCNFAQLMYKKK